jgi:hypothetical protein
MTTPVALRRTPARLPGVALLFAAALPWSSLQAADLQFMGEARSRTDGRLLYVESHHVKAPGAVGETRIVMYRCSLDGPAFARKELVYGAVREEPEFTFTDARSGYVEGLRRTAQGLRVFQQENARAPRREEKVPAGTVIVSDAGFDEFVRKHWAELEAGRTVRFPFLIPSRLDFLTFKVVKERDDAIDGAAVSVIRLNLSGVIGWFLPFIEVSYRKSDRVLLRYVGLTNIRDAGGTNLTARIELPARERRALPAGSVDLAKLRAEPLVARCPAG